jgi:hypothetical protein
VRVDSLRRGNPEGCEDKVRGNFYEMRLRRRSAPRNDQTDKKDGIPSTQYPLPNSQYPIIQQQVGHYKR